MLFLPRFGEVVVTALKACDVDERVLAAVPEAIRSKNAFLPCCVKRTKCYRVKNKSA